MTNMLRAAVPLATMLVVPFTSVAAKDLPPPITVVAPADHEVRAWAARVRHDIDRKVRYPRTLTTSPYEEGVVEVTFECGADGTPTNVAVRRSSGSRPIDKAAVAAVRRVRSLHPLPAGIEQDQVYRARLRFVVEDGTDRAKMRAAAFGHQGDGRHAALPQQPDGTATAAAATLAPAGAP